MIDTTTLQFHGAVEAAVKLINMNATSVLAQDALRSLARRDGKFETPNLNYVRGKVLFLAGEFGRARDFLEAEPQDDLAAFDLSIIDFLTTGKPPNASLFRNRVHSTHALRICLCALASAGRMSEVLSILNSIDSDAPRAMEGEWPIRPFFFCMMQKSGSAFFRSALKQLTGIGSQRVSFSLQFDEIIVSRWTDQALTAGLLPMGHCAPSEMNRSELLRLRLPLFISVRDPRDVAWSWFRFMEERFPLDKIATPFLPGDYCHRSYEERRLIVFSAGLAQFVAWLRSCKTFIESHPDHPVLISRYEDFAEDNSVAIHALTHFCGAAVSSESIDSTIATMKKQAKETGLFHFREGRAGSWRDAAIDEILAAIDDQWDSETLQFFGYEK